MTAQEYNYERFDEYVDSGQEATEFSAFPHHLHAGDTAPDCVALRLEDERTIRLSDVWATRNVVLEFGSFTRPYCSAEGPLLCEAAHRHPDAAWFFVYTREAHPGEEVGAHDSFETKLANARLLRDEIRIRRPILVDDLDGTTHRAYGLLPNMTWVIGRGGRILYKSAWTSAANIDAFLTRYHLGRTRRPPNGDVGPYATEQIEFRDIDREAFYRRLHRNGPRAYHEFKRAEKAWRKRG